MSVNGDANGGDLRFELVDSDVGASGGGDEAFDGRVFLLQTAPVDVQRLLVYFVDDDENRGVGGEAVDEREPILQPPFIFSLVVTEIKTQEAKIPEVC